MQDLDCELIQFKTFSSYIMNSSELVRSQISPEKQNNNNKKNTDNSAYNLHVTSPV